MKYVRKGHAALQQASHQRATTNQNYFCLSDEGFCILIAKLNFKHKFSNITLTEAVKTSLMFFFWLFDDRVSQHSIVHTYNQGLLKEDRETNSIELISKGKTS